MSYKKNPQNPNNFIIFDFETGGVDSKKNPVTEIAIISIDGSNLKKINEYQKLIAPYDDSLYYDPKAAQVSNISYDMVVEEGERIDIVAQEVLQIFAEANTRQEKSPGLRPILVGHNVQFDIDFLHHLFYYGLGRDYQKQMESVLHGRKDYHGNFQPSYLDTWSLTKSWLQEEKELMNYKLGTVVERLGVDINNAHRAMNDVVSTTEVLRVYLNNIRSGANSNNRSQREGFYFPI